MPYVEDGTLLFIGATTENPSFELNNALLSRARVYVLKSLDEAALRKLVNRALTEERGLGKRNLRVGDDAFKMLMAAADGDGRRMLNFLENASDLAEDGSEIDVEMLQSLLGDSRRRFDKGGEAFYDQISALHKSVRGSNPDGALYWFARMLDGGCDPLYIARRVVRMASEDIGNADPRALSLCLAAWDVQERLGSPEGELAVAQAITYLACAPKSNAVYVGFKTALREAAEHGSLEVPLHLRNAPTKLMKQLGYGDEYRYAHDEPDAYAAGEDYFPDELEPRQYYQPVPRGLELKIGEKLRHLADLDRNSPASGENHDCTHRRGQRRWYCWYLVALCYHQLGGGSLATALLCRYAGGQPGWLPADRLALWLVLAQAAGAGRIARRPDCRLSRWPDDLFLLLARYRAPDGKRASALALGYTSISVVGGLLATWAGLSLTRF